MFFLYCSRLQYLVYLQYDGAATIFGPPNTLSFDPKKRSRSLFETPKASSSNGGDGFLQTVSSILQDARVLFGRDHVSGNPPCPVTPSNAQPNMTSTTSASPNNYSPSKLPAFLEYAQDKLGVKNALHYRYSLEEKGFGPDILPFVDDSQIVSCGVSAGDAIRLKRGASKWWDSPESKRPRPPAADEDYRLRIRFEKRYTEGGSASVFGPGMMPGKNHREDEFIWWYYDENEKEVRKVPDGLIPEIDQRYLDENAPF